MSNYTEADVREAERLLKEFVGRAKDRAALDLLVSAALEGVKVPWLVADNAALHQRAMDALSVATESMTAFQRAHKANAALADLLKNPHPGTALLAELEDVRAAWHRETERADALQARVAEEEANHKRTMGELDASEEEVTTLRARVAVLQQDARTASDAMDAAQARATEAEKRVVELGRERDAKAGQHERQMLGAKQTVDAVRELQARAESERDALRAQVKALDEALDEAIQEVEGYDGEAAVALRRAQEAALSAPPAETTPAETTPALESRELRLLREKVEELGVIIADDGALASIAARLGIGKVTVGQLRSFAQALAGTLSTTPAPECAVCGECTPVFAYGGYCCARQVGAVTKRKCLLHDDCAAADDFAKATHIYND